MRVSSFSANEFGRLAGEFTFPAGKAVLIVEENEEGKSTLVEGLLAAMFGFSKIDERRDKDWMKISEVYRPWAGNGDAKPYGVAAEVTAGGKTVKIVRNLDKGSCQVLDMQGRDISDLFAAETVQGMIHLGKDDYRRVGVIAGKQVHAANLEEASNLRARLQELVEGSPDSSADKAMDRLTKGLREYPATTLRGGSGLVENEVKNLTAKIEQAESERAAILARWDACTDKFTRIEELESAIRGDGEAANVAGRKYALARFAEIRSGLQLGDGAQDELATLESEMAGLAHLETFPIERRTALAEYLSAAKTARAEADRARAQVESAAEDVSKHEAALRTKGDLSGAEESHVREVRDARVRAQEVEKRVQGASEAEAKERARVQDEGFDVAEFDALRSTFDPLSNPDKDFLSEYREITGDLEKQALDNQFRMTEIEGRVREAGRSRVGQRRQALAAAAIGAIVAIIGYIALRGLIQYVVVGAGLGVCVGSLAYAVRRMGGDGGAQVSREMAALRTVSEEIAGKAEAARKRLLSLAKPADYEQPDAMADDFKRYQKMSGRADSLSRLAAARVSAEADLAQVRKDVGVLLARWGHIPLAEGEDASERLARLEGELQSVVDLKARIQEASRKHDDADRSRLRHEQEVADQEEAARKILRTAAIPEDLAMDEARRRFEEMAAQYERFGNLRKNLIPEVSKRVIDSSEAETRRNEEQALRDQIGEYSESDLVGREPSTRYKSEQDEINARIQADRAEVQRIKDEIAEERREYRRVPDLDEQLDQWQRDLSRVNQYREAVETAREVLSDVSKEIHERWADNLNPRASAILAGFGTAYEAIHFEPDLSFTVKRRDREEALDRKQVDHQVSVGARDQIYLAARLAIAEAISDGGESLPIILDDPFIATDDNRFAKAMRHIIDTLGEKHQIIILTCHRDRHDRLRAMDPSWFDAHVVMVGLGMKG